ncbi:MAG: DegT/DnrJ/EryC1/StrS family aminotransferase [Bacteroidales bacterium]|nr:DegT/DnrJ/EryC1/StrS family aminotransferase [Candidatus Colimorpha onthohippi]
MFVNLKDQYIKIKHEIDDAILDVVQSAQYINGPQVSLFCDHLSHYLGGCHVIPCANGTDALQIAMMALDLQPGDEVIIPNFTYAAPIEAACLLKLRPVLVDINPLTFNIDTQQLQQAISHKTKAIIPVHLFGQCCDMDKILNIASQHNLFVIEDTAQALGAEYQFSDGSRHKAGTMGHIGCTSFFPTKNLGCFGDGGALFTHNESLSQRIRMIASHGQQSKYQHVCIGCNSRLDSIQAAVLDVKLKYLDSYIASRQQAADYYTQHIRECLAGSVTAPTIAANTTHTFHQYTITVDAHHQVPLKDYLSQQGIPTMIYYPIPIHKQKAYQPFIRHTESESFSASNTACQSVLSLPIHTELTPEEQSLTITAIQHYFK